MRETHETTATASGQSAGTKKTHDKTTLPNRKMAKVRVDGHLIKEALAMPSDTIIHNIVRHDYLLDTFIFIVEQSDLNEVPLCEELPEITATLTTREARVVDFEWNQE